MPPLPQRQLNQSDSSPRPDDNDHDYDDDDNDDNDIENFDYYRRPRQNIFYDSWILIEPTPTNLKCRSVCVHVRWGKKWDTNEQGNSRSRIIIGYHLKLVGNRFKLMTVENHLKTAWIWEPVDSPRWYALALAAARPGHIMI